MSTATPEKPVDALFDPPIVSLVFVSPIISASRALQCKEEVVRDNWLCLQPNPLSTLSIQIWFDISPTTPIGPGLYIGHFGGVVISPHAVLGANVKHRPGLTIGATSRGKHVGAPTLEDRVWVGAHAIIVGKITIGREALIAPGAYVNFDVPAEAVVLGNPGRVVSMNGSRGYVNQTIDNPEA